MKLTQILSFCNLARHKRKRDNLPRISLACARMRRIAKFRERQKRERLFFFQLLGFVIASFAATLPERSVWSLGHSAQWWENAYTNFDDVQYHENFRMTRSTFDYLCSVLNKDLEKKATNMRSPISVSHQVAITLWVLGTNSDYRTVAALFGVGKSTVCCIVHTVCKALFRQRDRFIIFPYGEELDRVVDDYKFKWGFPNVGGAIDGSHIPVIAPKDDHADYHNRKGWYSVLLQATVNDRYEFTDINVRWPGSVHDARVFVNSGIYARGQSGVLFNNKTVNIKDANVPVVLLGDPAYPLSTFLMKAYVDNGHLTPEQKVFNYKLSCSRMTVENAFGRLKGRWRCLLKRLDINIEKVPYIITACCILHNICEQQKDPYRLEWLKEVDNTNVQMPQPHVGNEPTITIQNATMIREVLTEYFQ